ncbi:amino acid ABC transporter permease [Inquilinus sp. NPDC058860]|uniref:amino acid ABC transporter permease n=1 Tax=Inquilinus sp. NPDC058860 TaxID=3346652 RepID=UPI003692B603
MIDTLIDRLAALGLDFSFIQAAYDRGLFLDGAVTTVEIAVLSILGSLVLGLVLTALQLTRRPWLAALIRAQIELTRNTPPLVQLYFAFFALNALIGAVSGQAGAVVTPFAWVVVVLSVYKAAFNAEALRAGLEAVPKVTLEAAAALGLTPRLAFLLVRLPIGLRFALPSLVNNAIDLVKTSAIASAIAVGDITYASIMIWSDRDNVTELMILLLVFFNILTFGVDRIGRWLEDRLRMPGYGQ